MNRRIPLACTFGNHMHWVDMQWLWGYDVQSCSTDDMLAYCREKGVKGCDNIDGVGYEKSATECPERLTPFGIEAARIKLTMCAHEIATTNLDPVPGRKKVRDIDAKREIWATVHRTVD